ncbi:Hsp70 family protein [Vreelandella piezotolerans]|uniref:Hsp70 family protein n=1 Tax=Vreelandella piezotolerans TaxID=2609667 RepID=A0ABQ6XDJ2_9GAMM|nr:Hsp70 family protein [Halomonas piezotolerans]KAE8440088.1 Hsp70 family protein [Halomonas piezotolerans]QJA23625.1 Hsp70 family protein [Halomonas piezotolerans]
MDNNKAKWLLENLLFRLADRDDGKQELPGIITEAEQQALSAAIGALSTPPQTTPEEPTDTLSLRARAPVASIVAEKYSSGDSDALADEAQEAAVESEPVDGDVEIEEPLESKDDEIEISLPSFADEPVSPDFRLCIDFGTAMSKVTLVHDGAGKDGGDEIRVLELGEVAGQDPSDGPLELLISSVYISNDGYVYFGKDALEVSEQEAGDGNRQRIDNMKRFLSEDGIDQVLSDEFNPTSVEIDYRDIVLFYLVYLTWVINQCSDELGYEKAICRRFAMPCFEVGKARQYSSMLSRMLGDAQVVADLVAEEISEGIALDKLKLICDKVQEKNFEYSFVGSPVTEPLGVASALVSEDGAANNLSMVIDIGAGTTDISLFRIRVDSNESVYVANQVPGAARGLTMAGNYIDRVLVQKILSSAGITYQSDNYRRIRNDLERKIRVYKEELFETGSIDVPLPNGEVIEVMLEELLQSQSIHEFQKELRNKIVEVLEEVDDFILRTAPRKELVLVLTGGGASLPFVRSMVGENIEARNISLKTVKSHDFPEWLEEDHADLENIFPRIAVSLGGARENVIVPYDQQNMELADA